MMMVVKEITFDAAHFLPGYDGPCARLHGHTYKLQVGLKTVSGVLMNNMILDFKELQEILGLVKDRWDHRCINDVENNPDLAPTAEWMVLVILSIVTEYLVDNSLQDDINVGLVRLWETPTSYCEWRPENA